MILPVGDADDRDSDEHLSFMNLDLQIGGGDLGYGLPHAAKGDFDSRPLKNHEEMASP